MSLPHLAPPSPEHRDTADLVRGALTSLLGKLALTSRVLAILLMTNLFGPVIFGLYDTSWKLVWTAYKIARFGLHQSVTRAIARSYSTRDPEREQRTIGAGLGLGLSIGVAVAAGITWFAPQLASFYEHPELVYTLRLMAWSLPFMIVAGVFIAATRALRIIKYNVYVNSIGAPMMLLVGTIVVAWGGWGLAGLSATQLAMGVGTMLLACYYFALHFRLRACLRSLRNLEVWSELAWFSFPVMLSDLINTLVVSIDQLMLLRFASAESVGVYAAARQISLFMRKAPQAFDSILGPIVAELAYQRRTRDLGDEMIFVLRWIFTINLAYLGIVYLGGDRLMLVFGARFAEGAAIARVLCLGMLAFGVSMPLEVLLIMTGHPYANLLNNSIWLTSMSLLNLWLIPTYGALGAAWSASSALFLVTGLRAVQSYRFLGLALLHRSLLKPFAAAGSGLLAGAFLDRVLPLSPLWMLLPEVLVFLATFVLTLYLLRFDERDRMLIDRLRRKLRRRQKLQVIPKP